MKATYPADPVVDLNEVAVPLEDVVDVPSDDVLVLRVVAIEADGEVDRWRRRRRVQRAAAARQVAVVGYGATAVAAQRGNGRGAVDVARVRAHGRRRRRRRRLVRIVYVVAT